MAITSTLLILLLLLLGAVGLCFLQRWLARQQSPWPGLVLPALCFLYSLVLVFSLVTPVDASAWQMVGMILLVLLRGNIFTLILLLIYFVARRKKGRRKELSKMDLQDL